MNRSSNVLSCSRCGATSHAAGSTACVYCGTHFVSAPPQPPQANYYAPPPGYVPGAMPTPYGAPPQMYGAPPGHGPPPMYGHQPPMNVYGPPQPLPQPVYINVRSTGFGWGWFFWLRIGLAVLFIVISAIVNLVSR